ncbi:hypothetical protein SPD48_06255 [Pseudogracilibacillus sp. SE30717A]|uniref:hypothetical protein n=1 Tax=Pseudogracilibacillus sp. SE30717A TaxID=3098293 RepID=UPI00300DBF8A
MVQKISLMDAYLIETARNAGYTGEDILLKISKKEIEDLQSLHDQFDYVELYPLFQSGKLKTVLAEGYQVKFLTFPGLLNLIRLKYKKFKEKDFLVDEFVIKKLVLNENEKQDLETWMSPNWRMTEGKEGIEIRPVNT